MMNTFKILSFITLFLFLSFTTVEAKTLNEIKQELNTAALALSGLSNEPSTRQAQLALISEELGRISKDLSAYQSSRPRVLGASTSSNSQRRPIAEVEVRKGRINSGRVPAGGRNRDILTFKVEPNFSSIWVEQIEVTFDKKVWNYLEEVSLVSGSKTLYKLEDLDDDDFSEIGDDDDDGYAIRFSGFLVEIGEDHSKTFKVKARAKESRTGGPIEVFLRDGAIRFFDEANFTQKVPYGSGGDRGIFSNEFEVE